MELIQTQNGKTPRPVQQREVTCLDCKNVWIKTYRGCKVKKPHCFMCKSKNTKLKGVK